jgi:hypothetical protein
MSDAPQQDTTLDPVKVAALRLYTLSERDRRWILRQLPAEQRQSVEGHLRWLRRLPMADALALVHEVREKLRPQPESPQEVPEPAATSLQRLLAVDVDDIRPVLDSLPAAVAAAVCVAAPDARWYSKYIAELDPQRREAIAESVHSPVAPRAAAMLIDSVVAALPVRPAGGDFAVKLAAAAHAPRRRPLARLWGMLSL